MRPFISIWAFRIIFLLFGLPHLGASDLGGTWEGNVTIGGERVYCGFDLDEVGNRITGAAIIEGWSYSEVFDGVLEGDKFRFAVNRNTRHDQPTSRVEFTGHVTGKLMTLGVIGQTPQDAILHRVESQITDSVTIDAPPKELEGEWVAHFVGRIANRPKMIGQIVLDLRVIGDRLTGVVHTSVWPGDCSISDGKMKRGHFSFTATGAIPSSSGLPVLSFKGEIHGNRLKLTMRHQMFGADNGVDIPLDAAKI